MSILPPLANTNYPFALKPSVPPKDIAKNPLRLAAKDTVSYNKVRVFDSLNLEEKSAILDLCDVFLNKDSIKLTISGCKPAALESFSKKHFDTLKKYKPLFESSNLKIATKNLKKAKGTSSYLVFIANVKEEKKVINKNINYFRYRMDNNRLKSDAIIKKLIKDNSTIFHTDKSDLVGVLLGYPLKDSIMCKINSYNLEVFEMLNQNGCKSKHVGILSQINEIITNSINSVVPKENPAFAFMSWDFTDNEVICACKKIGNKIRTNKFNFSTSQELLLHMLKR